MTDTQPQLSQVPELEYVPDLNKVPTTFDSVVVILSCPLSEAHFPGKQEATAAQKFDKLVGSSVTMHIISEVPGGRLIIAPTGPINRDYDDVRRFHDAARDGVKRAKQSGSTTPLIVVPNRPSNLKEYTNCLQVSLLAAFTEIYVPLQAREAKNPTVEAIRKIGFHAPWITAEEAPGIIRTLRAIEAGKRLAKDLGDPDPERMSPVNFTAYVQEAFKAVPSVKVTVKCVTSELEADYPLLMAVARASRPVPRHQPRVIRLEYTPSNPAAVEQTLYFAGKGVTYDTGGHDIKTGGIMAGMSRDKCGASNTAGFLLTCGLLAPSRVRVVAELGIVRNSVDSEGYVADEVIAGHSGVRVKIVNTDAEGRLVLADCLSHLRLDALTDKAPKKNFFSMATLTGHAVRSYGHYTAVVDNGTARNSQVGPTLATEGGLWGDCFEISTQRRDDFQAVSKVHQPNYDVLQAGGPQRGHQFGAVFLTIASGLDKHGRDSTNPLCYSHLDIAGSAVENCDFQFGATTACTVTALTATYLLK